MNDTKKLFSNTAIIFAGSIVSSIFSYLFNMLMGRMLGPAQYGEMAAILSLLTIVSVVGGVVMTTTMYYVAEMYGLSNIAGIKKLTKIFTKFVFSFSLILFLLAAVLAKPIANFFSIGHIVPVVIAFSSFIFGFVIMVNKGVLQGSQRFVAMAIVGVLEMAVRLFLAILLVKIGFALSGAIAATVIATALAYLYTTMPLSKLWGQVKEGAKTDFHFEKQEVVGYTLPVFACTLLLAVLLNLDVILVKHYFPSDQAGLYSAVSTVAKIILYITAPIISVMFPMILEKKSKGQKHYKMLIFSLGLTVVGAAVILAIYNAVPGLVMKVLYGKTYTELNYLLPQLGIFILFYTLINLLANYFLAVKNFNFIALMFLGICALLVGVSTSHASIPNVIDVFITSSALLFVAMIGYYFYTKKGQVARYLKGEYGQET